MCKNWSTNQSNRDVKICDIVLFIKRDGSLVSNHQYGMIHQLEQSKDDLSWKVVIKYWNLLCSLKFFSLNNLIFFIIIDTCEEKLVLWYLWKHGSVDWLFTDCFGLIIWYYARSCLTCYYFCQEEMSVYKPCFPRLFIKSSKAALAVK